MYCEILAGEAPLKGLRRGYRLSRRSNQQWFDFAHHPEPVEGLTCLGSVVDIKEYNSRNFLIY